MKSNVTAGVKGHFRRHGFKKSLKQKSRNSAGPKTRKELRKEQRKAKKAEKHTYLLKRFGKEPEPVPKKKRRQQKKKKKSVKQKSQNVDKDKNEGFDESGSESDYESSRHLKDDEDKLKIEMEEVRKKRLIEDNAQEDKTIRSLQKKLKLNKKALVPASFRVDGLDYLLDFCNDLESKKDAGSTDDQNKTSKKVKARNQDESDMSDMSMEDSGDELGGDIGDGSDLDPEEQDIERSEDDMCSEGDGDEGTSDIELGSEDEGVDDQGHSDSEAIGDDEGQEDSAAEDSDQAEVNSDSEAGSTEEQEAESNEFWEDIYGRIRDKEGNVVKDTKIPPPSTTVTPTPAPPAAAPSAGKYVPPMKRQSQQRDKIKKSLKGLFNRLSESNMHSIATQIESFYMENSRNEMNESLLELILAVLVGDVLSTDRLILEHVMLIGILHANVGTEVGAFFIQSFVHQFHKLYQETVNRGCGSEDGSKKLENLVLIIAYMYHFKIVDCCLIYDILKLLGDSFQAKDVELILTILRSIGFRLRKDDPTSLKNLIQLLQQKASRAQSADHGSRVKFMLEILLAIRNNNMSKIPNYDPSFGDHLAKIIKTFIHKGNYVSELKISMQDLLSADTKGRWWILGSAWNNTVNPPEGTGDGKTGIDPLTLATGQGQGSAPGILGNKKLMKKAKKLGMNTDTRRNIFFILMTAEDYADAFEKLTHLGLKNQLERELIHVLIYCCIHEKKFNPYYALLASKFCALDRRFMLTTQYTIWDRLKEFPDSEAHHLKNVTELLIHLIKSKSVPLTVLKVIDFSDMTNWKLIFLKEVLAGILLGSDKETLEEIFVKPGLSEKLHLFRDSLKLFMNHFMLNEEKVVTVDGETSTPMFSHPKVREQLIQKIEFAEKSLSLGHSKVQF